MESQSTIGLVHGIPQIEGTYHVAVWAVDGWQVRTVTGEVLFFYAADQIGAVLQTIENLDNDHMIGSYPVHAS